MTDMVDISNYQGVQLDLNATKQSGVQSIYLHAFEYGRTSTFPVQWNLAYQSGLQRGAYCFARPEAWSAPNQANQFISWVRGNGFGSTDFMVLDAEVDMTVEWVCEFMDTVISQGYPIALYCSTSYLFDRWSADERLNKYTFIIADYGPNDGQVHPIQHDISGWKVWAHQYTSVGMVPGLPGHVDCNVWVDNTLNPGESDSEVSGPNATLYMSKASDPGAGIYVTDGVYKRHVLPDEWAFVQFVSAGNPPTVVNVSDEWWDSIPVSGAAVPVSIDQDTIDRMATAIANALVPHLKGNWSAQ